MAGLSARTRSWFGQNQVGGRNTNSWEMVKPINSMVLDPVQNQPLCRSMNRFVSTQSPSSAIPRDLLPCGATSNLDGMTATNSRSRPPANSRLMVSRQTVALVTATVTAIPRSALVPGSLGRCGLRIVCRTAWLLGVPMYISASVASQRD